MAENTNIEDLKAPLLAAVGAADLALATVNEILVNLRDRAEDARTEAAERVEGRRAALTKLQEDLPKRTEELRGKLTTEELRKAAEGFVEDATATYNSLVERGEAALERLRNQPALEEAADRVEIQADLDGSGAIDATTLTGNAVIVASLLYHAANRLEPLPRKPLPAPSPQWTFPEPRR